MSAVTALEQDGDITDAKAKLEVLRKGCCHPQVWDKDMARKKKEGQRQHSHVARPFGEIMVLKVEQSRLMCEERQRELVFNLNSLAGVAILQAYIISMNRKSQRGDREIAGAAASGTTNYDVSSDEIVTDFSSPSRHDAISRGSDFNISSSVNSKVSALDYLRRALRAFTCAYSLLERNRGTCPLVGLLRVSGTPNTVFSVSRVVEEERNWGEAVDEIEDNLVDTELCADALCFTWLGQMNKNETGMEIMTIEEVKEPSSLVRSDEGNKDPGSLPSPDVPPAVSASTIFSNPPGLRSQLESCSIVSAKMAFGVGRRLQQLKVRSALRSVVSTLKAKLLGSKVNGVGSIKESVVMVFPKEVALLAATGTSDTFTRVTLCEISLPTLIESEATIDGCHYPLAGFADSFPIRGSATLTADIMKNFPLSFRARSWRLDVLTLHGWCLEIEVARMGHGIEGSEGCLLLEGVGKKSRDIDTTLQVAGQWRRLDDLTPVFQSGTSTTLRQMTAPSQVQMGLEIQVLEATFDIDLFQVPSCHCIFI